MMLAMKSTMVSGVGLLLVAGAGWAEGESVARVSDDIAAYVLEVDPTVAYMTGLEAPTHARFKDISAGAIARDQVRVDALLERLDAIDQAKLDAVQSNQYAVAREMLEAERGLRVCRNELWSVSHMDGWQVRFPVVAEQQPVDSADERTQALTRWRSIGNYIDADIANLRRGLAAGYAVPRPVVERVLKQVQGSIAAVAEQSPFYSPAARSSDDAFKVEFAKVVMQQINPALTRYRDFLRDEYLPRARSTLGVGALPDGRACYDASLRYFTTLDRPAEAVYELGKRTVAANVAEVQALGKQLYGIDDFAQIVARLNSDPKNHFGSEAEVLSYSRAMVERARVASARVFAAMPAQPLEVRPFPERLRGSGMSTHYNSEGDPAKPATFMLQLDNWKEGTRADAAITAFHEGYPGHHMQIALALSLPTNQLTKLAFNSAFIEGWARYAEALSEEIGLYDDAAAKISRRAWPARGMVVDPGIHVFGWTREQAVAYLAETGRFPGGEVANMVDRIAALPGQLTSYDSGGLEIRALRREAEAALGERFDLKAFHQVVLSSGVVPLGQLRRNVQAWVLAQRH